MGGFAKTATGTTRQKGGPLVGGSAQIWGAIDKGLNTGVSHEGP